jgi:hypothetical protein
VVETATIGTPSTHLPGQGQEQAAAGFTHTATWRVYMYTQPGVRRFRVLAIGDHPNGKYGVVRVTPIHIEIRFLN